MSEETSLCRLAQKWCCDKTPSIRHGYTPFYHKLFQGRTVRRLFEIGVAEGASLHMWKDYFVGCELYGIDNNPSRIFQEDRIHTTFCDVSNIDHLTKVAKDFGSNFDVIIDDGSHYPEHQATSFNTLLPFLLGGGVYIIEDVKFLEYVSNRIPFPHEIHRFNMCSDPSDDNLIVFFKGGR